MKIKILGTANAWGPNPLLNNGPTIPMKGKLKNKGEIGIRKFRTSLLIETRDESFVPNRSGAKVSSRPGPETKKVPADAAYRHAGRDPRSESFLSCDQSSKLPLGPLSDLIGAFFRIFSTVQSSGFSIRSALGPGSWEPAFEMISMAMSAVSLALKTSTIMP